VARQRHASDNRRGLLRRCIPARPLLLFSRPCFPRSPRFFFHLQKLTANFLLLRTYCSHHGAPRDSRNFSGLHRRTPPPRRSPSSPRGQTAALYVAENFWARDLDCRAGTARMPLSFYFGTITSLPALSRKKTTFLSLVKGKQNPFFPIRRAVWRTNLCFQNSNHPADEQRRRQLTSLIYFLKCPTSIGRSPAPDDPSGYLRAAVTSNLSRSSA